MADFKMPTFDDVPSTATEDKPAAKAPAKAAPVASPVAGFKMPVFEEEKPAATDKAEPKMKPFVGDDGKPVDVSGIDKSAFNGLMFGLGDRIRAATGIGVEGKNYDERLANAQGEREQFNKENPVLHYLTEGVPGLFTGAAATSVGKGALSAVAPKVAEYAAGTGVGPAIARAVGNLGTAAGFGAAGGAGSAKPGETLEGAKEGAVMGAGTALALQGVGGVGKAAWNLLTPSGATVARWLGVTDPSKWADKNMVETLLAEGHSPQSVVAQMRELSGKGAWKPQSPDFMGPPMEVPAKPVVMADVLPAKALGMVKKAGASPEAGELLTQRLGQRAVEAPERIANDIATNISDRTGASAEAARIIEGRTAAAKPLYDEAFSVGTPPADTVNKWFQGPLRKELFRTVENTQRGNLTPLQGRMTVDPATQEFKIVETPSIADLHTMRSKLSQMRADLWDDAAGTYKGKEKIGGGEYTAGDLKKHMDDLTGLIENLTGGPTGPYAKARKIYADDSSVLDALRQGQSILKTRPEDVAIEFGKLRSEAERDAYRSGISSILTDKAGSTDNGNAILKSVFGNKNIRAKLEQIYPTEGAGKLFPQQMSTEKRMQDTAKILAPSVKPHDFLETGGEASLASSLLNFASGRTLAGSANMAKYISGQADKMNPLYGNELTRRAMMSLPEAETWAADVDRRMNGPLSKLGRGAKKVVGALAEQVPYQAGNAMARQDDQGALERIKRGH
jgi:hypothetical protein